MGEGARVRRPWRRGSGVEDERLGVEGHEGGCEAERAEDEEAESQPSVDHSTEVVTPPVHQNGDECPQRDEPAAASHVELDAAVVVGEQLRAVDEQFDREDHLHAGEVGEHQHAAQAEREQDGVDSCGRSVRRTQRLREEAVVRQVLLTEVVTQKDDDGECDEERVHVFLRLEVTGRARPSAPRG